MNNEKIMIETERLILRRFQKDDLQDLYEYLSDGVHRVYAKCDPCNAASWKLLERLGFHREAHFRKNVYFWTDYDNNPICKDTYVFGIMND